MADKVKKLAYEIEQELIDIRRHIHRNPEIGFEEFETSKFVAERLRRMGVEVTEGVAKTGVVGVIRGAKHDKVVGLRADMDALPVEEENNCEYKSINAGVMHACGHDAHTAVLLGAASILSKLKDEIHGDIKLIFQPCEEGSIQGSGISSHGAINMINEGVLENPKVDVMFGLHTDPSISGGSIGYREGPIFAGMSIFDIEIIGTGGHAAIPHQTVDVIVVAGQVIQALQAIASRRIDPIEPFVLSIGTIQGGSKRNIIADKVTMSGTVRAFSKDVLEKTGHMMEEIISSITSANNAEYKLDYSTYLIPLVNDKKATNIVRKAAIDVIGEENVVEASRTLIGEDFALFADLVPASFIRLGTGFKDKENYPLHHPKFSVNESSLAIGAATLANAAIAYLQNEE
jgi:amidohydrolase